MIKILGNGDFKGTNNSAFNIYYVEGLKIEANIISSLENYAIRIQNASQVINIKAEGIIGSNATEYGVIN